MKKRSVALMVLLGIAVTWTALRAQVAVNLVQGSVDRTQGAPGTYTFQVTYVQSGNLPPAAPGVEVSISDAKTMTQAPGSPFVMVKQNPTDNDFTADGVVYVAPVNLPAGEYAYEFSASDGESSAMLGPIAGLSVNTDPQLMSGIASPPSGPSQSSFEYRVTYRDDDNHQPTFVQAVIDGDTVLSLWRADEMPLTVGSVYSGTTTLAPGFHSFFFQADDGYLAKPVTLYQDGAAQPPVPFSGPTNGAKFTGVVSDAGTSAPIEGATVSASGYTASTGPDGRYTLYAPEGSYTLLAQPPLERNLLNQAFDVNVAVGDNVEHGFGLPQGGTLEGNVKDSSGAAVANLPVNVLGLDGTTIAPGKTDGAGHFAILRMPGGNVLLEVAPEQGQDYITQRVLVTTIVGQTVTRNLTIAKGATLTCTVKDGAGNSLYSAYVSLNGADSRGDYTEPSGTVTWSNLPPGSYSVVVSPPYSPDPLAQQSLYLDLAAGENRSLAFTLAKTRSIAGVVRDNTGAPLADATIHATSLTQDERGLSGFGSEGSYLDASTGPTGEYRIDNVPVGTYAVKVQPPYNSTQLGATQTNVVVTDTADGAANFQLLLGATVKGTVTGGAAGTPVSGASVYLWESEFQTQSPRYQYSTTDSAGNYLIQGVPRGNWELEVRPYGEAPLLGRWHDFVAAVPGQTTVRNVQLPAAAFLKVSVTSLAGPVAMADVTLTPYAGFAYSGSDGVATIGPLDGGNYQVNVRAPYGKGLADGTLANVTVPAGQTSTASIELKSTGTISGTVVDPSGNAVVNAGVVLTGAAYKSAVTGSLGIFAFSSLPAGSYQIRVNPPDGVALIGNSRSVYLDPAQGVDQRITLPVSGTLEGVVTDSGGAPMANVEIGITSAEEDHWYATSGGDGRYRLVGMPGGVYGVRADAPSGVPALPVLVSGVSVFAGAPVTQNFRMPAAGILSGFVRKPDGQPLAGAYVEATFLHNYEWISDSAQTVTDGSYRFPRLPAGSVDLTVRPGGPYLEQSVRGVAITAGATAQQDFTVAAAPQPGAVRAIVTFEGAPAAGATATLTQAGSTQPLAALPTGPDGIALFGNLAPGAYAVSARPPGGMNALQGGVGSVAVSAGATADAPVALPRGGVLEGAVSDAAGVPASASLTLRDATGAEAGSGTSSGTDGTYRIEQLPAGVYELTVSPYSSEALAGKRITGIAVAGGQTVRQDVQLTSGASLRGVVRDSAGKTVVGATVVLEVPGGDRWTAESDRDGAYVFTRIVAGSCRVSAEPPDGANLLASPAQAILLSDSTVTTHDIVMPVGSVLTGRVSDDANKAVAGARAQLQVGQDSRSVITDEAGMYRFEALPAGPTDLTVDPPDRLNLAPARADAIQLSGGGTTTLNVTLRPGAVLTGMVTFKGQAVVDAKVGLYGASGSDVELWSDAEGRFTFNRLRPESYVLQVEPPEERNLDAAFQVLLVVIAPGTTSVVRDVALPSEGVLTGTVSAGPGQPATRGSVNVLDERGRYTATASLDSNGRYRLGHLASGRYRVEVWLADSQLRNLLYQTYAGVAVTAGSESVLNVDVPGGVTMAGRLFDTLGNAVADAEIRLATGDSTTTRPDGTFRLPGITPGTYSLFIRPSETSNLEWAWVHDVDLTSNVTRDFILAPQAVFTTTVTDPAGTPVSGATAILSSAEHRYVSFTEVTDSEGVVRIGHLPAGLFDLEIRPPAMYEARGLSAQRFSGIRIARGQELTIPKVVLGATGSIAGTVGDPGGAGVAGIPVLAEGPDGQGEALSDSAGHFRIDGLAAGLYWVQARPDPGTGWLGRSVSGVRVNVGAVTDQGLMLVAGGSLSGRVLGEANSPVPGAWLTLHGADGSDIPTRSGSDGGYRIPGLQAQSYRLEALPPDGSNLLGITLGQISVGAGENVTRDVTLPSGGVLAGTVYESGGAPVMQPKVWLSGDGGESRMVLGTMDGQYRFEGVRVGSYQVTAVATQAGDAPPAPSVVPGVAITQGQTTTQDLTLPVGGSVVAKVVDGAGKPVVDASVELTITGPGMFAGAQASGMTNTNGEARFTQVYRSQLSPSAFGLPSGQCSVRVSPVSGGHLLSKTADGIQMQAGQETVAQISLGASATLTGRVTDAAGAGLDAVGVTLPPADRETATDSSGVFRIEGVPAGTYDLELHPEGSHPLFLPRRVTGIQLTAGPEVVKNVALDRGAVLTGTVTEAGTGDPVAGAEAHAILLELAAGQTVWAGGGTTDADSTGKYLVGGLAPGRYRVSASAPSYRNLAPVSTELTLTIGQEATQNFALPLGGVIEGVVQDEAGQPVPGVSVQIGPGDTSSVTGNDGYFRLEQLASGTYDLELQPPADTSFGWQRIAAVGVTAGQSVSRTFVLRVTGEVKGSVTTSGGAPVANARVTVAGESASVLTDSSGAYHMGGVPAGPHVLQVTPADGSELLPASRNGVSVIARQITVADFTLASASMLTGVVKDSAGIGVEGAALRVVPSERGAAPIHAKADSVGHYVVPQLPAGRFDVTALPPAGRGDLLPQTVTNVVLGGGATVTLDLTLGVGGTVTGTVLDSAGKPLQGYVHVKGVGADDLGAPEYGALSWTVAIAPDGRYTVVGVPAGTYTVSPEVFSATPLVRQQARVAVSAGQAAEKSFVLSSGGSIAGRVTGPGGAGLPARVSIGRAGSDRDREIHVDADATGYYRVVGLPPAGDYRVTIDDADLVPQEKPAVVTAGQETVVDFQLAAGGVLAGRVTDQAGKPVGDAVVHLTGARGGEDTTDAQGVYQFAGLPEGTYSLSVAPPVGLPVVGQIVRGVTITAAQPAARDIQLLPASQVDGVVRRKTGEPVAGVIVRLFGAGTPLRGKGSVPRSAKEDGPTAQTPSSGGNYWQSAESGPDGSFSFQGLPAGHFTLVTDAPPDADLAPAEAQVDLGTGRTEAVLLALPKASGITGTLRGTAGTPLAGVVIKVTGPRTDDGTTTDAAGRFDFQGLAPGLYRIEAQAPYGEGSGSKSVPVEVPEGVVVTQDVSLGATGSIGGVVSGPEGPAAGASIRVSGPGHDSTRTTGADGSFLFEHLAPGVFEIQITPAPGARLNGLKDELVLAAGEPLRKGFLLPAASGSITGQVLFKGTQAGNILIALFQAHPGSTSIGSGDSRARAALSAPSRGARTRGWAAIDQTAIGTERPLFQTTIPSAGPFTVEGVPDGRYHLLAAMDLNGNGQVDPGEPVGKFGKPNAIFVAQGARAGGVSVTLQVPFAMVDLGLGQVTPRVATSGGSVNLLVGAVGADLVKAEVRDAATDASLGSVELADDGRSGDGAANDGLYGGVFAIPSTAVGDYTVDFGAADAQGNWSIWARGAGFTTTPFRKSAKVLLVNLNADVAALFADSQGNAASGDPFAAPLNGLASVEDYYADALRANGVAFDVWRTTCRGPVDPGTLKAYAGSDSAVVIAWPYQSEAGPDGLHPDAIALFLEAGGRLFISGQDIAWDAESEDPYHFSPVLHDYIGAGLATGSASFELSGRSGDVLADGLQFRVSGGDGANNQSTPDGIVALAPAQPILWYEDTAAAHTRASAPRLGGTRVTFPQARGIRKPGRAFSAPGDGRLCGGLRLDNGRYKVVYLAFGLEAIADNNQRALLLRRSLAFLTSPVSAAVGIQATASPTTLPADSTSTAALTATVTGSGGAAVADGTLVSFRGYNASVPASARTTGGSVTIQVRAGKDRGPMTVAVSSGAASANVVLNATPAAAGVIGARALSQTSVEVIFDRAVSKATAENAANYGIAPALAVTAATLSSEPSRVVLTTAGQLGIPYTVTVGAVLDSTGAPLGARASAGFVGSGPAPTVTLSASPDRIIADGKDAATITATVTTADGSPVPDGTEVQFSSTLGSVSPAVATTSGGIAASSLKTVFAGVAHVSAASGAARGTADVEVLGAGPAALTLTANPLQVAAVDGGASTLTATVTDALGRPMSDVPVSFSTDFGTLSAPSANTAAGEAKATVRSTTPGVATITATTANDKQATATVEFLAVSNTTARITVTAVASRLPNDGTSTTELTITLTDAAGEPVPDGIPVAIKTTLGSLPASGTTSGGGLKVTFTAGTTVGVAKVTVTSGAVTGVVDITLVDPAVPAAVAIATDPTIIVGDGASTSQVTATVTNGLGAPAPDGLVVRFTASLGQISESAEIAGGKATVTYTSAATFGSAKITATAGKVSGTGQVQLANPAIPTKVVVTADATELPADGASPSNLTAEVLNALGNPVPDGTTVSFRASAGTVTQSATTTSGKATAVYKAGTVSGAATITATSGSASGTVSITLTTATTAQGTIAPPAGQTLPAGVVIELRDANDNVVATGTVGPDGVFRLSSATSGVYDVVVTAPGYVPLRQRNVDLTRPGRAVLQNLSFNLLPQPTLGRSFSMMSVPFYFRNGEIEKVLGDPDAVVYWYDSVTKRYRISGIDGIPPADAGRGYWVKPRRGGEAYGIAEPVDLPMQSKPITLTLAKGWQIIGNPFVTGNITLGQVKVLLPGTTTPVALDSPATTNKIRAYLWTWSGSGYDLVSSAPEGRSTILEPYRGYWVRTLVDGIKIVCEPPTRSQEPTADAGARAVSAAGWRAWVQASVGGRAHGTACFGIGPSAYVIDSAPAPEGHVDLHFVTPEGGRAGVAVQGEGAAQTSWSFEVAGSSAEGDEVTLTWPGLGAVPRATRLVLVDEQTGQRWQMRTTPSVTFRSNGTARRFRMEAQKSAGALVTITGVTLSRVRGSGRSIGYVASTDVTTTIAVTSGTGRTIRRVAESRAASKGRNEAYWDGRDDRGVAVKGLVLVEITATTEEGATVRAVQPAMLVD